MTYEKLMGWKKVVYTNLSIFCTETHTTVSDNSFLTSRPAPELNPRPWTREASVLRSEATYFSIIRVKVNTTGKL